MSPLVQRSSRYSISLSTKILQYRRISTVVPPFLKVIRSNYFENKVAIIDEFGQHRYETIVKNSSVLSKSILHTLKQNGKLQPTSDFLAGERVAFVAVNNAMYTVMQWAIWMAGGMAVPLAKTHPQSEIEYVINDSKSSLVLMTKEYEDKILSVSNRLNLPNILINDRSCFATGCENDYTIDKFIEIENNTPERNIENEMEHEKIWNSIDWEHRHAMLVYTSGTTGPPKGVLSTFLNVQSQLDIIVDKWGMTTSDHSLHVLPLHHVHGIVNALACPLWSGGSCGMMKDFNAKEAWRLLLEDSGINVLHAVPTIYSLLIDYYQKHFTTKEQKELVRKKMQNNMRLMVSGSASLPDTVMKKWENITGHVLLERYGMTEIFMALTNPLHGKRIPGAVGKPFPTVEVRIVSNEGDVILEGDHESVLIKCDHKELSGQLQVKGPSVFKQYWNNIEATNETFTEDGWFITGDTVGYDVDNGVFRIMGRTSVDIIKSGGYKISALDVERHLLTHESIKEVAVVGLPSDIWGQELAAVVVLDEGKDGVTLDSLKAWAAGILPPYQIPRTFKMVSSIPRNAMGKINKKNLIKELF